MNDLEPGTRALLARVKNVGPEPGTKDRVRARVLRAAVLGVVSAPMAAAAASGSSALFGPVLAALCIGAAAGTVVSAVPLLISSETRDPLPSSSGSALRATPRPPSAIGTAAAPAVQRAQEPPAPQPVENEPSPPIPRRALGAAETGVPSIERETALLTEAQRALRRGDPGAALETLARYEREFPKGALAEEALAVRAVAACSRGDRVGGQRTLAELARRYPRSPLLARAEAACEVR
jgi:hypothetical protein